MLVRKLSLKNYSIHSDLELEFAPGINGIVGPNGSGKSTILDAIRFAVTGQSVLDGKIADNISWGEKASSVRLEFSHGDSDYVVHRKLGKTTSQVLSTPDGELNRQSEIQAYLERLLGTTFESLLNNVFVPQGRIESILFATNTQRLREIQRVVGLDNLALAEKALGLEISSIQLTPGLKPQIEETATLAAKATQELETAQAELVSVDNRYQELEPVVKRLESYLAMERSRAAILEVDADLQRVETRAAELSQDCLRLRDEYRKQKADLDQDANAYTSAVESLAAYDARQRQQQLVELLNRRLSDAQAVLARPVTGDPKLVRERLDNLQATLSIRTQQRSGVIPRAKLTREQEVESRLQALEAELKASESLPPPTDVERDTLHRRKQLIQDLETFATGKCPTCGQAVHDFNPDEAQQRLRRLDDEIKQLQTKRRVEYEALRRSLSAEKHELARELVEINATASRILDDVVTQLKTQIDGLQLLHAQLVSDVQQREQAERDIQVAQAQLQTLSTSAQTDDVDIDACRALVSSVETRRMQLQALETQLKVGLVELSNAQQQADKLRQLRKGFGELPELDPEQLQLAKDQTVEFDAVRQRQQQLQRSVGIGHARVQSLLETVQRLSEQYKNEALGTKWVELCKRVRDIVHVSGLPTLMMQEYATVLNRRMQYYLTVWESPFVMRLDETLSFVVEFDDERVHSANRLSGGQQIVASTSFRLAMVETFARDLGFLVLDEPSNYLDQDNRHHLQQLLLRLRELASASGRQILLVTHEASFEGFFDHTINLYR